MKDPGKGRPRGSVPANGAAARAGAPDQNPVCRDLSQEDELAACCGPACGVGRLEEVPARERVARVLLEHIRQHPEQDGTIALTLPLDGKAERPDLSQFDGRVRVVFWRVHTPPEGDQLKLLWQNAKDGVWNVVLSDTESTDAVRKAWDSEAAAEPGVVHARMHLTDGGTLQAEEIPSGYGETAALRGRPLWTRLVEPAALLRAVSQYGAKTLSHMRSAGDGSTFTVGEDLEYHFAAPAEVPAAVFDEVLRLIAAGGAVTTEHVRANLETAFLIGYVIEGGRVVADSSLKHPREEYIEAVRLQTGFDLRGFLERGYTSVRPEYRGLGIGTKLLAGLTARAEGRKFYSIIAEDNEATKTMARRNNTVQVGAFFSTKMNKQVGIWTAAEFAEAARS